MKALISLTDRQPRASAIEKSLFALARAATHPLKHERREVAKMVYADDTIVSAIVERGEAPIATTTATGFAAELTQNLVGEFLATLAPVSAAARLMQQGMMVRMGGAASMKLPAREGAPSTTVNWVGEGDPIPARAYELNGDCVLVPKKFGLIVGLSREVAKLVGGEGVVRQLLREDASASLDGAVFSADAGDTESHAGMLYGIDPLTGYAGGDREAMETDLAALSDVVSAGGSGALAFVVSPRRANRIRIKYPDIARELVFLPSLAVADSTVIATDPLSFAWGAGDDFEVATSTETAVHMDTEPEPISTPGDPPTVAGPVRSYWQTDSLALRLIADVAFAPRRPNAAAWLQEATW